MYSFCRNVYFVKGPINGAIYDFNKKRFYQLNENAVKAIDLYLFKDNLKLVNDERQFLENLKTLQIIEERDSRIENNLERDFRKSKKIEFAWIEVTNSCNLKCIHCYEESDRFKSSSMPYQDFCKVIDELVEYGVRKIQLIGGEPFVLKNELVKMLDYAVGKFEYIEVYTNGTLIQKEWFDYFKENNIRIALSVYSYDDKMHDQVTQSRGSWAKTNETINNLSEKGVKYRVQNVLLKNIDLAEKNTNLYNLSQKKDIVRMTGRANLDLISESDLRKKLITKKSFSGPLNKPFVERIVSGHNCFSSKIYISSNLDVYPCVMERRLKHGSLVSLGLKEILKEEVLNYSKNVIRECECCELRYFCFDCRPDALGREIDSKPWYCTYNPLEGKWIDEHIFIKNLSRN